MSGIQDMQRWLRRSGNPATFILIGVLLATFIISWLSKGQFLLSTVFTSEFKPVWGILTFPFTSEGNGMGLFFYLLLLWWMYWVGSAMEREVGAVKLTIFFFAASILAALFLTLGAKLHNSLVIEWGPALAVSALTVAWGARNPTGTILLYGVIPLTGQILMWLDIALTLFGYGSKYNSPLMGVFACLHLGLAYLFAKNRLPGFAYSAAAVASSRVLKAQEKRKREYYDDVQNRAKEREEKERLRKMFEGSLRDDPEDKR